MNCTLNKSESAPRVNYATPQANIRESSDGYVLEAEMPGVNKDGLEITVEKGELTIVGRRTPPSGNGSVLYRESRGSDYRRAFELDPAIDTTRIAARIEQGVLTLHLPKAEAVKPRKIAVN